MSSGQAAEEASDGRWTVMGDGRRCAVLRCLTAAAEPLNKDAVLKMVRLLHHGSCIVHIFSERHTGGSSSTGGGFFFA